jgi:hypothetical protein
MVGNALDSARNDGSDILSCIQLHTRIPSIITCQSHPCLALLQCHILIFISLVASFVFGKQLQSDLYILRELY